MKTKQVIDSYEKLNRKLKTFFEFMWNQVTIEHAIGYDQFITTLQKNVAVIKEIYSTGSLNDMLVYGVINEYRFEALKKITEFDFEPGRQDQPQLRDDLKPIITTFFRK